MRSEDKIGRSEDKRGTHREVRGQDKALDQKIRGEHIGRPEDKIERSEEDKIGRSEDKIRS